MKFLILTASYGEGHNTAARNIREAILQETPTAQARIADLYSTTNPHIHRWMQRGYSLAINRLTPLWKIMFLTFSREGLIEMVIPFLESLKRELGKEIASFKPDVIVATYPIYSFLLAELREECRAAQVPFVTVVTDSTIINSSWYRCGSDAFTVADTATQQALCTGGVSQDKIHVLGFPVSPVFAEIHPLSISAPPPWKILFLPSARATLSLHITKLLLALPNTHVTVLSGKHSRVASAIQNYPFKNKECLTVLGWTNEVPRLLASHHVFIGKAGGAFIQEAIAAQCPIIVSHVVPGQEEGNIRLIETAGVGILAGRSPTRIRDIVARAFANDAALWKVWKKNIAAMGHPFASRDTARFLLKLATQQSSA